jgi:GDPmannose 4,6-dehydratase
MPTSVLDALHIVYGDITDKESVNRFIREAKPDQIYHLAAQSSPAQSWYTAEHTYDVIVNGTNNILMARKEYCPDVPFLNAVTCQIFRGSHINEDCHHFAPASPYAVAKTATYFMTQMHGGGNAILWNHESRRRSPEFVTQKIIQGAKKFMNDGTILQLGNMDARRDWGHAKDFVEAFQLAIGHGDVCIGTGEMHSVKEFVQTAFALIVEKHQIVTVDDNKKTQSIALADNGKWVVCAETNPQFYRPEQEDMVCDNTKIKSLGWKPQYTFESLIADMI